MQMALISLRLSWISRRLWPWLENIPREGEGARLTPRFDGSTQAACLLFPPCPVVKSTVGSTRVNFPGAGYRKP
jgi:hypothetical protein